MNWTPTGCVGRSTMPRFHLHIWNGLGHTPDEEGQELADATKAHEAALKGARSILSAEVSEGRIDLRGRIEVQDADGAPVLTLLFADAVEVLDGDLSPPGATG